MVSNEITILVALLTGGLLITLIEVIHLNNLQSGRFHTIMKPFMSKLTGYVRFINLIQSAICFNKENEEGGDNARQLHNLLKSITKKATIKIVSGEELKVSQFTAKGLHGFCEDTISNVWYYISNKNQFVEPYLEWDASMASMYDQNIRKEIVKIKKEYGERNIDLDLIADISGDFYTEIYSPISDTFYSFEYWQKISKRFTGLSFLALLFLIICILVMCYLGTTFPFWLHIAITSINVVIFILLLLKMIRIHYMNLEG